MANHALKRGQDPFAEFQEVSGVISAYLYAAKGDLEEALRLAAQDVVALNGFARSLGEAVSWGFARRPRPAILEGDQP